MDMMTRSTVVRRADIKAYHVAASIGDTLNRSRRQRHPMQPTVVSALFDGASASSGAFGCNRRAELPIGMHDDLAHPLLVMSFTKRDSRVDRLLHCAKVTRAAVDSLTTDVQRWNGLDCMLIVSPWPPHQP